jgi:hypothetical protein
VLISSVFKALPAKIPIFQSDDRCGEIPLLISRSRVRVPARSPKTPCNTQGFLHQSRPLPPPQFRVATVSANWRHRAILKAMSEASSRQYFRDLGEFCCGSHGAAVPEADSRAVCPYCGARRKLHRRKSWDELTLPPHYVPCRPSPATVKIPQREQVLAIRALINSLV